MKKLLYMSFCLFVFASISFTQTRKIDDFGSYNSEDLQARLEIYSKIFAADPTSFMQFLIYRGEKDTLGSTHKFGGKIKAFLQSLGINENQIIITSCANQFSKKTEIWILENKENLQTCEKEFSDLSKTFLFDSIYYENYEMGSCCSIDEFKKEEGDA
jgi:hypothetical protein